MSLSCIPAPSGGGRGVGLQYLHSEREGERGSAPRACTEVALGGKQSVWGDFWPVEWEFASVSLDWVAEHLGFST